MQGLSALPLSPQNSTYDEGFTVKQEMLVGSSALHSSSLWIVSIRTRSQFELRGSLRNLIFAKEYETAWG